MLDTFFGFMSSLIAWQNMLFTATVALGALMFGVQALGVFGDHDQDADADVDHDHHLADGHDADHDHDLDHDADHDHDVEAHGTSAIASTLKLVGVGKIPLSLLLPLALSSFGFAGLFASLAFGGIGKNAGAFPELFMLPVLGLAFAGSLVIIQVVSRVFKKVVPDMVKTASDRYDLLGLVGIVKSGKLDTEFGQVRVKDNFGHELELPCIALDVARGAKYGDEVVLIDWDAKLNRFKAVPFEHADPDEAKRLADGKRRARELRKGAKVNV